MKLLVDNQLPEALARFLAEQGIEARHVRRLGLGHAADSEIWTYAKIQGYGIVTMDEDFQYLAARYGTPPQVVWVRLGNVRRVALIDAFRTLLPNVVTGLESGVAVIEVA